METTRFKHGLTSELMATRHEDPAALDVLKADLRREHQPANTTEEILVNEMAEQFWRVARFRFRESCFMLIDNPEQASAAVTKLLPVFQRLMSAAERGFQKALATLRQLQKDRGFVPHIAKEAAAASGFVPQNKPKTAPPNNPPIEHSPAEPDTKPVTMTAKVAKLEPQHPVKTAKQAA